LSISQLVWAQALRVLQELQSGKPALKEGASKLRFLTLPVELKCWLDLMKRILEQTRTVLDGNVHIPNRLISLFDPGARPIQKGKLFPRTEFGRKVLIQEAEKGLVTDYQIHEGNPPDQPMLEPALDKHEELFGHIPTDLAADRGFYAAGQDEELHERGVKHVSIPVKGNKDGRRQRTEKSSWFRGLQAWRSGGEGKISLLKRKYGFRQTKVRGTIPTAIVLGWGVIAHNLVLLSRLGP
jgi:IS5 family transposase